MFNDMTKWVLLFGRIDSLPYVIDAVCLLLTHQLLFSVGVFLHMPLIAFKLDYQGTWYRSQRQGSIFLSGETFLQEKSSTGHRWDSNSGPFRQHGHCCQRAKPLRHLDRLCKIIKNRVYIFGFYQKHQLYLIQWWLVCG